MDSVRRCIFDEGTHQLRIKSKFCKQSGKLDYSRYSEVSLLTLYYHWQTLSISFLLEMVIAKDPSYLSLQYFMYSVTVAYHLTLCSNNIGTHNETMNFCLLLSFFFICINLKRIPYINCIILTEGVVNRTIHIICMYVYK